MNFKQIQQQALQIRSKYAKLEEQKYGREWTSQEIMLGFMKDVGDLAKLVQAKSGVRDVKNVDENLAHELTDCLWSIIVLAGSFNIDLEAEFDKNMKKLSADIDSEIEV